LGAAKLNEEIIRAIESFEAPGIFVRAISDYLLSEKEFDACALAFRELFRNKKRKYEPENMRAYLKFLFASGRTKEVNI